MKIIPTVILFLLIITNIVDARERLTFSLMSSPLAKIGQKIIYEAYQRIGIQVDSHIMPAERALVMSNKGYVDGEILRIKEIASLFTQET